jgi:hypothetical protein
MNDLPANILSWGLNAWYVPFAIPQIFLSTANQSLLFGE